MQNLKSDSDVEETRGMVNCPICGVGSPHHHSNQEVQVERVLRPKFERVLHKHFNGGDAPLFRTAIWHGSYGLSLPTAYGRCYPAAFGWQGVRDFGNKPIGRDHWAYREHWGADYFQVSVEVMWRLWLEAVSTRADETPTDPDAASSTPESE